MDKRGIGADELKSVLIAVAVVLVMFLVLLWLRPVFSPAVGSEVCRSSVILKIHTTGFAPESPLFGIECSGRYVEFRKDGVYRKDEVSARYERVASYGKDKEGKIKEFFARELADCWFQFDEGNALPFNQEALENTHHCVVCAELKFDDSVKKELSGISGFGDWLRNNAVADYQKYITTDSELSYLGYLDRNKVITRYMWQLGNVDVPVMRTTESVSSLRKEDTIYPEEKYYVLLLANVPAYLSSLGSMKITFLSELDRYANIVLVKESDLAKSKSSADGQRIECQRMY